MSYVNYNDIPDPDEREDAMKELLRDLESAALKFYDKTGEEAPGYVEDAIQQVRRKAKQGE
jgi:hypothetical protein